MMVGRSLERVFCNLVDLLAGRADKREVRERVFAFSGALWALFVGAVWDFWCCSLTGGA